MPDMYYSTTYEHYADYNDNKKNNIPIQPLIKNNFRGGGESLYPVINTIPRNSEGYLPYTLSNTNNDYNKSKIYKTSPLNKINRIKNLKIGKELYNINCAICHGDKGDGQGFLVEKNKILSVPDYKNRDITIGSIYHVIMYGKNMMRSYSEQLNEIDRWRVAEYVWFLKNNKS
jgi:hypothetical protein